MKTAANPQKAFNPHSWFFAYVQELERYDRKYEKAIREGIVWEYSLGQTTSLKEFHEIDTRGYRKMKVKLQQERFSEMDLARKRVIAILFSYLRLTGYRGNISYIRETACRAAKADSFNAISLPKLKQLYRIFGEKYKKKDKEWTEDILNKIADDVSNGVLN